MIHYLQFRCFVIDKFCEQPHNNGCCRLVIVDDPKGHYRSNCWYPHAEKSDITFTEDGFTWYRHDALQGATIPIPGDILEQIFKVKHPPDDPKVHAKIYAEMEKKRLWEEKNRLERQNDEYAIINGVKVKIEKPTK